MCSRSFGLTFLMLLILTFSSTSRSATQAGALDYLDWQLPLQNTGQQGAALIRLRVLAKKRAEGADKQLSQPGLIQAQIISRPYQNFVVCSGRAEGEEGQWFPEQNDNIPTDNRHELLTIQSRATLWLLQPQACQPDQTPQNYTYHSRHWLYSDQPFLVQWNTVADKRQSNEENDPVQSPEGFLPGLSGQSSGELLSSVAYGGFDHPGDFRSRRPPGLPFRASDVYSLTLLPGLQLPDELRTWFASHRPDLSTWYWLLDQVGYAPAQTLLLRFDGQQPLAIPIHGYEQQELAEHLTSQNPLRNLLNWLAPKLNGRAGLVEQLLAMQAGLAEEATGLDKPALTLIRQRLEEILGQPDREFDLAFERFRLQRDWLELQEQKVTPLPEQPDTGLNQQPILNQLGIGQSTPSRPQPGQGEQQASKESPAGSTGQNRAGGGASSGSGNTPPGHNGRDDGQAPGGSPNSGAMAQASGESTTRQPLVIHFIGRFNTGKSSLANCLLNYLHFPENYGRAGQEDDAGLLPGSDNRPRLKIRSLPGYDAARKSVNSWLEENPIDPSGLFVLVLAESPDTPDIRALKALRERGVAPEQVVFVRNKIDSAIQPILEQKQITAKNTSQINLVRVTLEQSLGDELNKRLKEELADQYPATTRIPLYFTSSKTIWNNEGIMPLAMVLKKTLSAMEHPNQGIWGEFMGRRNGLQLTDDFFAHLTEVFVTLLEKADSARDGPTIFSLSINQLNRENDLPEVDESGMASHQKRFENIFGYNPGQAIQTLREGAADIRVDRGAIAAHACIQEVERLSGSELLDHIASELRKSGFLDKQAYVDESARINLPDLTPAQREAVIKQYWEEARHASELYLSNPEVREKVLCDTRRSDWVDWLTFWSDTPVIKRFQEKMITALIYWNQGLSAEVPAETSLATASIRSARLTHHFAVYYLFAFYGPRLYQRPRPRVPMTGAEEAGSTSSAILLPDLSVEHSLRACMDSMRASGSDEENEENTEEGDVLPDYDFCTVPPVSFSSLTPVTPLASIAGSEDHIYESMGQYQSALPPPWQAPGHLPPHISALINQNIMMHPGLCKNTIDHVGSGFRQHLKKLVKKALHLRKLPGSAALFKGGFYRKGVVIPLLYALGASTRQMETIADSHEILDFLETSTEYSGIISALEEGVDMSRWPGDEKVQYNDFLRAVTTAAGRRQRLGGGADPLTVLEQLRAGSPEPPPGESVRPYVPETSSAEHNPQDALEEVYTSLSAARAGQPTLIALKGQPPSGLARVTWQLMGEAFDRVYRGMEALNEYTYNTALSLNNPGRTRINTYPVAEPLLGLHLKTAELFEQYIGIMEDPVIVAVNGFGNSILHAFLVFRNSRLGEYNSLHIRQGTYYPEFMDRAATERYFREQKKRVLGAVSLSRLAAIYGSSLNLQQMRQLYKDRCQEKDVPYRIRNQNCMTFSMLAFAATDFDLQGFLTRMGLDNLQSPNHILLALAASPRNQPALYIAHSLENTWLLPSWMTR